MDKKLKKIHALGSLSASRMAPLEGGEGAIDGVLAREYRAGYSRGILDVQGLPGRLAEWAEQEAREQARREAEQEETWDDQET